MFEDRIAVPTEDGPMETFVVWPEGAAPFPAVIMYHHIGGLQEGLLNMARRLASYGYCVFVPSLYWRAADIKIDPDNRDEISIALRGLVVQTAEKPGRVTGDTRRLLNYMRHMQQVDDGPRGAVGYCLGGLFAIRAACVFPGEIKAAASLYGVGFLDDDPEDLEATLSQADGTLYLAFADEDRHTSHADVDAIRTIFDEKCEANWNVELYPGTKHGFSFPGRPMFDFEAAEASWDQVLSLFRGHLGARADQVAG